MSTRCLVRLCPAAMVLASLGCSGEDEESRAPTLGGCLYSECGGGAGGSVSSGSGGSGATCEPDPSQGHTVSGDLHVFDGGATPVPYLGIAELTLPGAPCGFVTTTFDGSEVADAGAATFELLGVRVLDPAWLRAEHKSGGQDVLTTYRAVTTHDDITVNEYFGFVSRSSVDLIFEEAGLTRDVTAAQLLVEVLDLQSGLPLPDVVLATAGATKVVYEDGGNWAELGKTSASGKAALLNVNAASFPGTPSTLSVKADQEDKNHQIIIEAGAVTLARIGVGFQAP